MLCLIMLYPFSFEFLCADCRSRDHRCRALLVESGAHAGRVEPQLCSRRPREPRRVPAHQRAATGGAHMQQLLADATSDQRVGAKILDVLDGGAQPALEDDADVLGPYAERTARA